MTRLKSKLKMQDICDRTNVSVATVSRAFTKPEMVKPETLSRILEVCNELGFRPNLNARSLISNKTHLIGLALAHLEIPRIESLTKEIETRLMTNGYHLQICLTHSSMDIGDKVVESIISRRFDGLIFQSWAPDCISILQRVIDFKIPCVMLGQCDVNLNITQIGPDAVLAARTVAEHLISLGHKRIAIILSGQNDPRIEGIKIALSASHLKLEPELVFNWDSEKPGDIVQKIMSSGATAAYVCHHDAARDIYRELKRFKIRVPEQLALAGQGSMEDTDIWDPPMTIYEYDLRRLPEYLVNCIVEKIDNPDAPAKMIIFNGRLVPRESTLRAHKQE